MPTDLPLSLAEELYLVLHYDPATGELLRNGKVNGSEAQVLSAAKLVDLIEGGRVSVERTRTMREAIVATEQATDDAALDEARAQLWQQKKDRSITWGLSNLGSTAREAGATAAVSRCRSGARPHSSRR